VGAMISPCSQRSVNYYYL